MIQIIQREQEITNMFLEDTAQGDWVIKLGKADFEKVSIGRKRVSGKVLGVFFIS